MTIRLKIAANTLICLFILQTLAFAIDKKIVQVDGEEQASLVGQKVMVAVPRAAMGADEKIVATAELGTILVVNKQNDDWFWIASHEAWIEKKSVIPAGKAIPFFTERIKKTPTAESFHHRGIAYEALGNNDAALADFDESIRRDGKVARVFISRGYVWEKKQQFAKALADYNLALRLDPKNALAFFKRSGLSIAQKSYPKAMEDLNAAIKLNPRYAEAYHNRGICYWQQGNRQAAIAEYNKSLELNPFHVASFANRGFAFKTLGEYQKAIEDYQRAIHFEPQSPNVYNDLAWLLATCPDEVFRDGTKALEFAKYACQLTEHKNANYLDTLAAAHAELSQFPEALKWGQKAAQLAGKDELPSIQQHMKQYENKKAWRDQPPS